MNGPLLIGIDVGTTSVKAVLLTMDGEALRTYASPYPTMRPRPGEAEQDPGQWMRHVLAALRALTDGIPLGAITAAGLTSQVNTHVFVDGNGEALRPAILWQDGRCAAEAEALDNQVKASDRLAWWGAPLPIDASHPLARALWLSRHHSDFWQRTRFVMVPKDYCLLQLTGEASADPLSSFGIVDSQLRPIDALLALVPGASSRLPPLTGPLQVMGRIRPGLPGAGLPLVTGTMDAWAGLIGAGATRNAEAVYLSGTSEVGAIVSHIRIPTPGVIAFPSCEGIVLHAGPTQSGGASLAWLSQLLDKSPEDISALAAQCDQSVPAPIFLPHLQGERAPLWDTSARGSFAGLDSSMGAPHMARAVLEGVAYSVRLLFASLESSAGEKVDVLRHAGGGARSDVWCQIRADVLGRRLERVANLDSGALGAAMLAGVGAGLFPSITSAATSLVKVERVFHPDPSRADMHDTGFAHYLDLYRRLKGFTQIG